MRKTKFVAESEIEHLFQDVDLDQTGMIKYSEFLAACLQEHLYLHEDRVVDAFNKLDIDHSGVISRENIKNVLGDELNVRVWYNILESFFTPCVSFIVWNQQILNTLFLT